MQDPARRTSDSTIMAVCQLLCNEIADQDYDRITIHEQGLEHLIQSRGGIGQLGGDSTTAASITM